MSDLEKFRDVIPTGGIDYWPPYGAVHLRESDLDAKAIMAEAIAAHKQAMKACVVVR